MLPPFTFRQEEPAALVSEQDPFQLIFVELVVKNK
jgi:hypothetical protein